MSMTAYRFCNVSMQVATIYPYWLARFKSGTRNHIIQHQRYTLITKVCVIRIEPMRFVNVAIIMLPIIKLQTMHVWLSRHCIQVLYQSFAGDVIITKSSCSIFCNSTLAYKLIPDNANLKTSSISSNALVTANHVIFVNHFMITMHAVIW